MTLDELNQINVNDPAAIKALQTFLRSRGYYSGAVDGKWGGATIEGVKALRGDLQTESANRRGEAEAQAQTEAARNSPARMAKEAGPYAGGALAGLLTGRAISRKNAAADAALGAEVQAMPGNRQIRPTAAEATMDRRMADRRMRPARQALAPAAMFGLAEATRRYIKPNMDEEARPYVDMAANAEQGVGVGLAGMVAKDAFFGKNPIPADTEALIRSRAAEARGDPQTVSARPANAPAPDAAREARMAGLRARTAKDLRTDARAAGLPVSGTKDDLVRRLADAPQAAAKGTKAPRGKAGVLFPLIAGGVAYDAASSDAEAAGLDEETQMQRGALAGGAAAAGTAGISRLAPYVADAVSKSPIGRAALRAVPVVGGALTAYDLGNYMAQSARPAPESDAFAEQYARTHPRLDPQAIASERAAARQAIRSQAAADTFDSDMQAFFDAIDEHNAAIPAYGP